MLELTTYEHLFHKQGRQIPLSLFPWLFRLRSSSQTGGNSGCLAFLGSLTPRLRLLDYLGLRVVLGVGGTAPARHIFVALISKYAYSVLIKISN